MDSDALGLLFGLIEEALFAGAERSGDPMAYLGNIESEIEELASILLVKSNSEKKSSINIEEISSLYNQVIEKLKIHYTSS